MEWDPLSGATPWIRMEDDSMVGADGFYIEPEPEDTFDFSDPRWQDKVFVVPPEDVPTGIAQILPKHPMTAAAGRLAQKQAAKAVRQAARQAARDASRAANEPGPSAIEMQIQAARQQVHVEEPMEVINIPEFDRVDDLLDEYSDLLYGDEPLTGEALLNQQEFLQKTLTEVGAVDDPVEYMQMLVDTEKGLDAFPPVEFPDYGQAEHVIRDPWAEPDDPAETLGFETVVKDLKPLTDRQRSYGEWVREHGGRNVFKVAQEAREARQVATMEAGEPYGPKDWVDTMMDSWEFWDKDPEVAVDKMLDDVHVDMAKNGRSFDEALDNLRELTGGNTPTGEIPSFNQMSTRVGKWRDGIHTPGKEVEMQDLGYEEVEVFEMEDEFSSYFAPGDLEMVHLGDTPGEIVHLTMPPYDPNATFGSLAPRDSWATGAVKNLVSEYSGKLTNWGKSLPGKGVRQLLPGSNILDWKGKLASKVDKFLGVGDNTSGTTKITGGSTEIDMNTAEHGAHEPVQEYGIPEEKWENPIADRLTSEAEMIRLDTPEVIAGLNELGRKFPSAQPLERFVGVSASGEAMVNLSGLKEWAKKQVKGLMMAPLLIPLSTQMGKVMEGGQTWFNLGLSMLDIIASGDPLGLALVGITTMISAEAAAQQRVQDNLDPQKERGKKYGFVRVGGTWYPAFSDTDFKGTGWWDSSNATAMQYGENMIFKRVFVGSRDQSRIQPFFEDGDKHYKTFEMSDDEFNNQVIPGQEYNFVTDDEVRYGSKAQLDNWDPLRNWYLLSGDDVNKMMSGIASGDVHATDSFKMWTQEKGKTTTGKDMNPYEKQVDDWRRVVELMHSDPALTASENLDLATFDITDHLRDAAWQGNGGHDADYGKRNALFGPGYEDLDHEHLKWDTGFENADTEEKYYDVMTSDNDFYRWSQPENKWLVGTMMQDQVQALLDAQRYAAEEQGFKDTYYLDNDERRIKSYGDAHLKIFHEQQQNNPIWASLYLDTDKDMATANSFEELQEQWDTIDSYNDRTATQQQYLEQKAMTRYWIGQINSRGGTETLLDQMYSGSSTPNLLGGSDTYHAGLKRMLGTSFDFQRITGLEGGNTAKHGHSVGDMGEHDRNMMGLPMSDQAGWVMPWQNAGEDVLPNDGTASRAMNVLSSSYQTAFDDLSNMAEHNTQYWINAVGKLDPNRLAAGEKVALGDRSIMDVAQKPETDGPGTDMVYDETQHDMVPPGSQTPGTVWNEEEQQYEWAVDARDQDPPDDGPDKPPAPEDVEPDADEVVNDEAWGFAGEFYEDPNAPPPEGFYIGADGLLHRDEALHYGDDRDDVSVQLPAETEPDTVVVPPVVPDVVPDVVVPDVVVPDVVVPDDVQSPDADWDTTPPPNVPIKAQHALAPTHIDDLPEDVPLSYLHMIEHGVDLPLPTHVPHNYLAHMEHATGAVQLPVYDGPLPSNQPDPSDPFGTMDRAKAGVAELKHMWRESKASVGLGAVDHIDRAVDQAVASAVKVV